MSHIDGGFVVSGGRGEPMDEPTAAAYLGVLLWRPVFA